MSAIHSNVVTNNCKIRFLKTNIGSVHEGKDYQDYGDLFPMSLSLLEEALSTMTTNSFQFKAMQIVRGFRCFGYSEFFTSFRTSKRADIIMSIFD